MDTLKRLRLRDVADGFSASTVNLLIALLSMTFFALVLSSVLVVLRRLRRRQQMCAGTLPQYNSDAKRFGNRRGLTIHTATANAHGMRSSVIVFDRDGQPMLSNPQSPPHSPANVPEIHITFPDEQDEQGRPKSGRVVVVRVGEAGAVGLEPLHEEQLPAYEKESKTQFYAVDMDRIGGLKEKAYRL